MDLDPVRTDVVIAEHRRRIKIADRFGPLYSPESATATAAPRRTSAALTAVSANLFQVIGAAWRSLGKLPHDSREVLRSDEHDLAAKGIRWPADGAYDAEMAEEVRAARQRRLAAGTITPLTSTRQARGHGTAMGTPRASASEALVLVGRRLRVSPHAAAVSGGGQSGD